MKLAITVDMEDYVYEFYKKVSSDMEISMDEVLSSALYMYAGIVALDIQQNNNKTDL